MKWASDGRSTCRNSSDIANDLGYACATTGRHFSISFTRLSAAEHPQNSDQGVIIVDITVIISTISR